MKPVPDEHREFLARAIELAAESVDDGGGPFGAVVVCDGRIVGEGTNRVTATNDPTAHAEVVAVREACRRLSRFQLGGCLLYASCEPCPMCLGAAYWSRVDGLIYSATRRHAADAGFDDAEIYDQLQTPEKSRSLRMQQFDHPDLARPFDRWRAKEDHIPY